MGRAERHRGSSSIGRTLLRQASQRDPHAGPAIHFGMVGIRNEPRSARPDTQYDPRRPARTPGENERLPRNHLLPQPIGNAAAKRHPSQCENVGKPRGSRRSLMHSAVSGWQCVRWILPTSGTSAKAHAAMASPTLSRVNQRSVDRRRPRPIPRHADSG